MTDLIVRSVARIANLQRISICKDSKKNILRRGIERNVILKRDPYIQGIITNLLSSPFHDKDETLSFQHHMYRTMMSLEAKSLEKESVSLNCLIAKQRRILKTITTETVFKLCAEYLVDRKAAYTVLYGRENEVAWKAALEDKEEQSISIDKWLSLSSSVSNMYDCDDAFVNEKLALLNGLQVSKGESVDIYPDDLLYDFESFLNVSELDAIDADTSNEIMNGINDASDRSEILPHRDSTQIVSVDAYAVPSPIVSPSQKIILNESAFRKERSVNLANEISEPSNTEINDLEVSNAKINEPKLSTVKDKVNGPKVPNAKLNKTRIANTEDKNSKVAQRRPYDRSRNLTKHRFNDVNNAKPRSLFHDVRFNHPSDVYRGSSRNDYGSNVNRKMNEYFNQRSGRRFYR